MGDKVIRLVPRDEAARARLAAEKEQQERDEAERVKRTHAAITQTLREWSEASERGEIAAFMIIAVSPEGDTMYEVPDNDPKYDAALLGSASAAAAIVRERILIGGAVVEEEEEQP